MSFGVETINGLMEFVVEKGTNIPVQKEKFIKIRNDGEQCLEIKIYEGEDKDVNKNRLISSANIDDINEPVFKWILTQKKEDEIESFQSLKDENETIIEDNIKLLYTGKKNDKPLYVDYSTDNLDLLIPHIIKKEEV